MKSVLERIVLLKESRKGFSLSCFTGVGFSWKMGDEDAECPVWIEVGLWMLLWGLQSLAQSKNFFGLRSEPLKK